MLFDGPAGSLEGELDIVSGARTAAVLCHPHPQMGGTMHDAVLSAVQAELARLEVTTLKFNYRGVGASDGSYDNGQGETDDVLAAARWIRENADAERLIIAGYSFGGVMALRAAEPANPDALLLVAPAVSMAGNISRPEMPALVILAEQDQFVDVNETRDWFGESHHVVTLDTDHFFFGQHDAIGNAINDRFESLEHGKSHGT